MGRSTIGLCACFGGFVGSYVPVVFGASSFGLASLLAGAVGGILGVWAGVRISEL